MLHKFKSIEEIGRFSKLTHKAEPFTRLSLIFGRNGYGKSTLCSILRSATDGQANHISMRRRLGAIRDSRVETSWASGTTYAYSAGRWNACPGKIYIFDQEYVSKNLHVGDSVTRENKRSLLPVVLGDDGVALSEKVISLDKEQRAVSEKQKVQEQIILARCRSLDASKVLAFCKAIIPENLTDKINDWEKRVQLAKQAAVVKQKPNPSTLELEGLEVVVELLSETIDGLGENTAQRVAHHLAIHDLGLRAHNWLEYGSAHAPQDSCPFCDQDTRGNDLVAAYKSFFSDEFKNYKARIDSLTGVLAGLGKFGALVHANDVEFAYWADLCNLSVTPTLVADEIEMVREGLDKLKALAEAKQRNPLEIVEMGTDGPAIHNAVGVLIAYNEKVAAANAVIDQARADTTAIDIAQTEIMLAKWHALAERAVDPVKAAVEEYLSADDTLRTIRTDKAAAQKALTSYTAATMTARQTAVNSLLFDFGASFRIVDAKTNFVGRDPNTEFAIEIGARKVKAGDRSDIEPSFKTVLSAGDKTTLALAFFIAQVNADLKLADAVVVFDDPFNSQDLDRQFQTTSHIRSIGASACQTIVMSHDPRFLNLIEKNADQLAVRTFQLQCSDSGEGSITQWRIADELKSLYLQQSEMIREYASHQKILKGQTLNSIKQAIRPFLEDYLRLRFPGRFPARAQIFEMAQSIQNAGRDDPLSHSTTNLFALNEYTRSNMHGGGDAPVPNELRTHCQKVVAIVGSY
ncbi:AAA family ATPase [Devosia rhodophyticola]|uniref:AAA family ATPase n=1 Tax=Devosia rhodophyticola TaxID=3026423 RepID=A0ABY7Z0A4_9HYPH|nr:AAA family ATPase [Devosia rhodophyticola]WDR06579.1 AAA family ATPase [Devosia rhodophyticola]